MSVRLLIGDCREVLKTLPDESVHCVMTSPPYFGLRDYGTATWEGGEDGCDHRRFNDYPSGVVGTTEAQSIGKLFKAVCGKCGARRIDSQIGLEPTPDAYVAEMVAVFREVRRVLRRDGTVWLNLGDSYSNAGTRQGDRDGGVSSGNINDQRMINGGYRPRVDGLKNKDLIGIPWRVAFALQADGWWLRQDIIWAKPNPMPESVTDRCTKAHEYLFLLTRSATYWYDAEAIAEEAEYGYCSNPRMFDRVGTADRSPERTAVTNQVGNGGTRNKRSVWTVPSAPFSEAHFATFPPALIEPCIKAGCPEKACGKCGAPWVREVERSTSFQGGSGAAGRTAEEVNASGKWAGQQYGTNLKLGPVVSTKTLGFSPSCTCNADTVPGVCLDPFFGAGTTGLVADRLGRNCIGIELNPAYAEMGKERIVADGPLFAQLEMAL